MLEVLLGDAGALVVLLLVFASPLALVPLLVAAVSILSTFLVLRGLAALTEVSFVVQFVRLDPRAITWLARHIGGGVPLTITP